MADNTTETPKALFEDPKEQDKLYRIRTLKQEIKDARPIETGDIILTDIETFEGGKSEGHLLTINVATFKPGEEPEEFIPGFVPYPQGRDLFLNGVGICWTHSEPDGSVEPPDFKITDSPFHLKTFLDGSSPKKSEYDEAFYTSDRNGKVFDKPILNSTHLTKILDPEKDLARFQFSKEQSKKFLDNAVKVRQLLAQNLLDQTEELKGAVDPRLQQLDDLINGLSTQVYFGK